MHAGENKESGRPKRHPDAAFRPIGDDGGLVVMPDRGNIAVLNPVGIKIYSLLDGEHTAEQIVAAVTEEFEISESEARSHLEDFLGELDREGLLDSGKIA